MIRSELVARIAAENPGLVRAEVEKVVHTILNTIAEHLSAGGRVELRGFGAFTVRHRDACQGRNPRTGEAVQVEGKSVPFFRAGKELRDRLNPE